MTPRHLLRTMPLPERIGLWMFAWTAPVLAVGYLIATIVMVAGDGL